MFLLKEVLDNCIDEFVMGFGKQIDVETDGQSGNRSRSWSGDSP